MDTGSRVKRDPRSGAQLQTSDEPGTGGQWDVPAGQGQGQGQWQGDTGQQQRSDVRGQGGAGQFGSADRFASDDTSGSADLGTAQAERDDDPAGSGYGAKPSVTGRAMGATEKMAGKVTRDPGMQARGEERKEGLY